MRARRHAPTPQLSPPAIKRSSAIARRAPQAGSSSLSVGAVDDPAERDADRIADRIVAELSGGSTISRAPSAAAGDSRIASAGGGPVSTSIEHKIRSAGTGRPLDHDFRGSVEPVLGTDLGRVRIHHDRNADTVSRQIDARAFTLGNDIFFRSGEYSPGSPGGQRLLAHELGHVAQSSGSVRRMTIRRFVGDIGRAKEGDYASGDDQAAIEGLLDLADALHQVGLAQSGGNKDDSFASGAEMSGVMGGISIASGVRDAVGAGFTAHKARQNLALDDSISKNLGATQAEEATTGFLGSGMQIADAGANSFGSEVPGLSVAVNIKDAIVKGKGAVEDSVAAGKLQNQKTKIKREQDLQLPTHVRLARFDEFIQELQSNGTVKRSDRSRFTELQASYGKPLNLGDQRSKLDFLAWMQANGHKDLGYGTEYRKTFEKGRKMGAADGSIDYMDTRSLGKVAAFGHRRKAETATVQAVEATGAALDAAGTFTAAGDMGATMATGKALKAGAASYKGVKGLVKKARRVHKLRTAKNELAYGGKADRGVGWGMKQFFGGNLAQSQGRVLEALDTGTSTNGKSIDPAQKAAYGERAKRLLSTQLGRRCDDVFTCLGSQNKVIRDRAKAIIHIVAETNLAGAIQKIQENDLDKLSGLLMKERAGKSLGKGEAAKLKQMKDAVTGIFEKQLAGVGG